MKPKNNTTDIIYGDQSISIKYLWNKEKILKLWNWYSCQNHECEKSKKKKKVKERDPIAILINN